MYEEIEDTDQPTQTEPQLDPIPVALTKNTHVNGVLWLPGVGNTRAEVMFISHCVNEDEALEQVKLPSGYVIKKNPRMLNSMNGKILGQLGLSRGVDIDAQYYTTLVKYLPEKREHRVKPTRQQIEECMPCLEWEINRIKPKIIVCLGKQVFDLMVDFKAKEDDVYGAWFKSEKYNCLVYLMPKIDRLRNPEMHERYAMDFSAVVKMLDGLHGKTEAKLPTEYTVVHNSDELRQFVGKLIVENRTVLSVDCEWEGHQHVDGKLRSLQICWEAGKAAYIRFMDDNLNYAFDVSYEEAGKILGSWLNMPQVKYIGHHVSADLAWMFYWLHLDWYEKAIFDTEFALQSVNESSELGLEYLALKYTDVGRYDWPLIWYRKTHPERKGNGYGMVPDDILIPYALLDVDVVMRCYPIIYKELEKQQLVDYYNTILNPVVTDVFTSFCLRGIPMDRDRMSEMRDVYNWAKGELEIEFLKGVEKEAKVIFQKKLREVLKLDDDYNLDKEYNHIDQLIFAGEHNEAKSYVKNLVGAMHLATIEPYIDHYLIAPSFNIRSSTHMRRWLFDIKGYIPVQSTANKAAGMPATDWNKVLTYPPEKQKQFTPATNKQTISILAAKHSDKMLDALLEFNAVGNICKAFLKPAEIDEETGEVIAEKGLHYWVASDDAAHLMNSTTETGRFRS